MSDGRFQNSKSKIWQVKEPAPPDFVVQLQESGFSALVAQLLYNRGLQTAKAVERFFSAGYGQLGDPFDIKDMDKAVERIKAALANHECIAIYGDFDADGVTACSLLVQFFKAVGATVVPRIPHRVDEGYGLNPSALRRLAEMEVKLVITVDCGISNVAEAKFARDELNIDIIVTDHHRPPPVLPAVTAILNTRQPGDDYPDKGLTGVGVAFHLVRALTQAGIKGENLKPNDLLDLVALGTVADIGPLQGENRILVKSGLKSLNKTTRPGILALIEVARLKAGQLDTNAIGFGLAPRLNAAGRIDDAILAYELLLTDSLERAKEIAQELDRKNKERQQLLTTILAEAYAKIEVEGLAQNSKIIVIGNMGWNAGVVGLVAGRLSEAYARPVLVLEQGETVCKGSARSPLAFNIIEALTDCAALLERFGGHRQAAGFTIKTAHLPEFTRRLHDIAEKQLSDSSLAPQLEIDAVLSLKEIIEAHKVSQQLAPFGSENQQPLFASYGLRVQEARAVGNEGLHLKLKLFDTQTGYSTDAIAFREGKHALALAKKPLIDVAYNLEVNEWQGNQKIELVIRDFKF